MMKWPNICCTQYNLGRCVHPAAPTKTWFNREIYCIEVMPHDTKDSRIGTINKCKVKIPYPNPRFPEG